jgi:glycine dehydrogenase
MTEYEFANHIRLLGRTNKVYKSYIGLGYHPTVVPAAIQRNIFENPSWYTTPYQAEIAQGRLEAILNFQTMVIELTGMEIANASLLDESTAAARILLFDVRSRDQKKSNVNKFFVSEEILPQTLSVLQTRSEPIGVELVGNHQEFDFSKEFSEQYFNIQENTVKFMTMLTLLKAADNEIKVAVADILSLVKLTPPGEIGAAVVVGTTQRFSNSMGYGGHTPLILLQKKSISVPCQEESLVYRKMLMEIVRCVWRYKHVNNISNVRKQHLTFVLHRFYYL